MPSAGASRSAKNPAKLKASELAFRKRSTQSSSTFLYITRPDKNITYDSKRNEASSQTMCRLAASGLLLGCVRRQERWSGGGNRVRELEELREWKPGTMVRMRRKPLQ